MERSVPMKRRYFAYVALLLILLNVERLWAGSHHALVLATSASSPLQPMSLQEARKVFLGVPLEKDGERIVPLLNNSDPITYEVFLQKVAFMSAKVYESQTVSIVFRLGGKRPEAYANIDDLVAALRQNRGAVTFLWEEQVKANQGIKTVSVLWEGSPD